MSVRKRGNSYQVTYRCPGESSPRTETFKSEEEAYIRDMQIKLAKKSGKFEPPRRIAKGKTEGTENVTVKELAQKLYISEPSIRRDLIQLENQRLIKRTHGGAMLEENDVSQIRIPFAIRELECSDEKIAIAKSAAALVKAFVDAPGTSDSTLGFVTKS